MIDWESRPIEIQTLLNPAFCGEVLLECIKTYEKRKGPFPFSLSFLALPILLHPNTRSSIPYSSKYMHLWIQTHRELLVGFKERAKNLVPIALESITFLLHSNVLFLNKDGDLISNPDLKLTKIPERSSEIMDCINKAHNVGKLFASAGNPASIFAMWGVCP
ncbi:MAG: DUF6521 family protein [Nitrosopumilus sp.]|nr:DUF6521 family protein [Nitrosopumilus sp.]